MLVNEEWDRVFAHRVRVTDSGCWEWVGNTNHFGHGRLKLGGKTYAAHRVSWALIRGSIPKGPGYHGTCVLHSCDNPPCVNTAHLFLGSAADNSRDMSRKGRARSGVHSQPEALMRGEDHVCAKLTEDQVREIRRRFGAGDVKQRDLAVEFGVSKSLVGAITQRKVWRHVI